VTSQIAEKPTVFRLALAPSIVNPRYNRLWLIPADGIDTAVEPSAVVAEFRAIFADLGKSELKVHTDEMMDHLSEEQLQKIAPDWLWAGRISPEIVGKTKTLNLYIISNSPGLSRRFHETATRAGTLIPNRVRDVVIDNDLEPTTAFAWWMAAVWAFSTIPPLVQPDEDDECKCWLGVYWSDPIASSLSDGMKLIGKPFGYVTWGVLVGICLGIASTKRSAPDFPVDVPIGAVLGALVGYGVERYALRAAQRRKRLE
jgi:hypothetical protein